MDKSAPRERQHLAPAGLAFDCEVVTRQWLPAGDLRSSKAKRLEGREACGLAMQVPQIEPPAAALLAAMLADYAVEPALQPRP